MDSARGLVEQANVRRSGDDLGGTPQAEATHEAVAAVAAQSARSVPVTITGLGGEVLWGPAPVAAGIAAVTFVRQLAEALQRPPRSLRLVRPGCEPLHGDVPVAMGCVDGKLDLTLVFVDPPPDDATIIGELAVWNRTPHRPQMADLDGIDCQDRNKGSPRATAYPTALFPSLPVVPHGIDFGVCDHQAPQVQHLIGQSLRTDDSLSCTHSLGRCSYMALRFGCSGLYYNSSSHGTVSLSFQTFPAAFESKNSDCMDSVNSDCSNDTTMVWTQRGIIPGPHCPDKDRSALTDARTLADNLFMAVGQLVPARDCATLAARSWLQLLSGLGVEEKAAQLWTVLWMPWLEDLSGMNECDVWEWIQAGYPNTLAEMSADSRQRLQQSSAYPY